MSADNTPRPAEDRLLSIDALRGFDMFWIIGADTLVAGLRSLSDWPPIALVARQLEHAEWHGFTFYDLVFPLFVYVMGVSIPLALGGRRNDLANRSALYRHILRRAIVLYLLGVFFYGGLANHWHEIRWVGVLQRIAVCYLCGAVLYLNLCPRGLAVLLAAILVGYWLAMAYAPVPGFAPGDYSPEGNFAGYVDRLFLPGRAWFRELQWDPEGLLSTLPAVGTCLMGILSGVLLRERRSTPQSIVYWLLLAGAASLALGYAWGFWFPINKKMWTSSFVLVSGGYSCLSLAAFYQVIDVWRFRKWCIPFVVIGANAIFIYLAAELIPFDKIAHRFVGGNVADWLGKWANVAAAAVQLALEMAILWWMYRRRIFIRI